MEEKSKYDFIAVALKNGLLTKKEADFCQKVRDKEQEGGVVRSLRDIAIDKGFISPEDGRAVEKAIDRFKRDEDSKDIKIRGHEVLERIGYGGLGVVYRAKQLSMGRIVALKVLHKKWLTDEEFKKRFLLEARLAGRLSHQNLFGIGGVPTSLRACIGWLVTARCPDRASELQCCA